MCNNVINIRNLLLSFLFIYSPFIYSQWNPNAGLIESLTKTATIEVSSGDNKKAIVDGDLLSYWESTSQLPNIYITNSNMNIFLDSEKYIVPGNNDCGNAFDGIVSSKTVIDNGKIDIEFVNPTHIHYLSFKLHTSDTVWITVITEIELLRFSYLPSGNYSLTGFELPNKGDVVSIKLESSTSFEVFEIAGLYTLPTEEVVFDLGKTKSIGWIGSRHYNGKGVISITIFASQNRIGWKQIAIANPMATAYISQLIKPEVLARYIKVKFVLSPRLYQKAKLLEFDIYDKYGPYGKPYPTHIAKNTYSQSFGINAIWGWGYSVYSDQLANKLGPEMYISVAKLARNYHSIDWDINKPIDNPNYVNMGNGNGTAAKSWLNWDREYDLWKLLGYNIDACIMFNNQFFSDTLWRDTKKEARNYGKYFASHFSINKSLIAVAEIGNEPWEYSKPVYRDILAGMSEGLKQNSSNFVVLPCAIQAFSPGSDLENYISNYLDASNSTNIDGLNTHVYSYIFNNNNERVAVNPEDRRSEVWSICNLKRFSATNMSNKPIFVTEFGYDSDGGGDDCIHSVCVSEFEQAIYGVRMTLILYRLGVSQFYWYYFANVNYNSIMHNRSGLTSSYGKGMQKKLSFKSFELLQKLLGNYYFHHIIKEDDDAYIYAYSDNLGKIKLIIAWQPTSANHTESSWISFPLNETVDSAVLLVNNIDKKEQVSYVKGVNELKISISGVPVIIILKD